MKRVEVVRAPACDHSEAIRLAAKPPRPAIVLLRMNALLGVERAWRRPEPAVVVQVFRHWLFGIVRLRGIDGQANFHAADVTETSTSNHFARAAKLLPRALLAPHLENAAGFHGRVSQQHAFFMREREGFLQVHVFARTYRSERDLRVPVIGRADDNGVDVFAREHFVEVCVLGDRGQRHVEIAIELLNNGATVGDAVFVEVAYGQHVGEAGLCDARHVVRLRDAAAADVGNADAVARCRGTEDARRQHPGCDSNCRGSGEDSADKSAPREGAGSRAGHGTASVRQNAEGYFIRRPARRLLWS